MAVRVTRLAPAAAQESPDQEVREQSLRALRLELESQADAGLAALLQHEVARLHERREDLASAARDELAATKKAAGFVEPVEGLIDIATRSRSKANLAKLLERLTKLARSPEERHRATLGLALTHLSTGEVASARKLIEGALDEHPTEPSLWLALEAVAAETGDSQLLLKAATGRAAHANSEEMRCLLLERVARLEVEVGTSEAAFAALRQSVDELPSWRALRAWEELGLRTESYEEAEKAAFQTATILRAALEEPEEASLYQIPREELSEERATLAHVRAIIYAIRSGSDESATELCEQLRGASPHSALAAALLVEMRRKQGDSDAVFAGLTELAELRKWNSRELAWLHGLRAVAARQAGRETEHAEAARALIAAAPNGLLPQLERWQAARATDETEALRSLLSTWAREAKRDTDPSESDALYLALALLALVMGSPDQAQAALSERSNGTDALGPLVLYAAQSLAGGVLDRLTLPPGVGSEADRAALSWERIRRHVLESDRVPSAMADGITEDPWGALILSLLSEGISDAAPSVLDHETQPSTAAEVDASNSSVSSEPEPEPEDGVVAGLTQSSQLPGPVAEPAPAGSEDKPSRDDAAPSSQPRLRTEGTHGRLLGYLNDAEVSGPLRRALEVFELAAWGNTDLLRDRWHSSPSDPLLAAAYLATLERQNDPLLASKRRKAAERQEDGLLRAAWLLKAAADELERGNALRAEEAYDDSEAFIGDARLKTWFQAARGPRDPQVLALGDSTDATDDPLERAAVVRRWAPDRWSSVDLSAPSAALQLLQILEKASESLQELEYALDDSEFFSEAQRAALPLSRSFSLEQNDELLAATGHWVARSPSPVSKLTHWVAATRAREPEIEGRMIQALAEDLEAPSLLAALPAAQLRNESRAGYRELLRHHREGAEGTAAQSLSWAIVEHTDESAPEEYAAELWRLGVSLDPGMEDADAQGALLLAGYEYLSKGKFEEANQVFERLLEVLPGDLTLCQGARIAAARVGRPDLEAITSCELARATEDNLKSAALWERAGVLFEDELDDREEAEKCYTAALARSPGSRVSFERVYRFARDRNDRQRQVELIDARLDTAESEGLLMELYWEKARFCRMLGRRTIALRSLEELLKLAPNHLPALALSAELHLVDGRIDAAADALRVVAQHPDTPPAQRGAAGLHACDLYEQMRRHRDAVELLQVLDEYGVSGSAGLERRARSLARSEDWGEAYKAFAALNDEQDEIETRLESARMMLAIQRDHLRDPEELKRSARCVLRDAPLDPDAIQVVLEQEFATDERRRLLTAARGQSREVLRRNPLNPPEIRRFAGLCRDCGEDYMERISLGILGLTGKLSDPDQQRLAELLKSCLALPSQPLSRSDLEALADPLQLGAAGTYLGLLAPHISEELDPSPEALGFSSLMRTDEFSGSPHRAEIGTWMGCFGHGDFELYVGGSDPDLITTVHGDLPTVLVGRDIPVPLSPRDRARVVVQLAALHHKASVYLNHSPEELKKWIYASEIVVGARSHGDLGEEVDELARLLAKSIAPETREKLASLHTELSRAGIELAHAPYAAMRGAARAASLAHGECKVVRELPDLIPTDQDLLSAAMSDIVRFVLSNEFINIRRRIGLEGT